MTADPTTGVCCAIFYDPGAHKLMRWCYYVLSLSLALSLSLSLSLSSFPWLSTRPHFLPFRRDASLFQCFLSYTHIFLTIFLL